MKKILSAVLFVMFLTAAATAQAPATFQVKLETSAGEIVIQSTRDWGPNGADRFYELVKAGFFDDCRFFRVVKGFMVQWGLNGTPQVNEHWATIKDDFVKKSNSRGRVSFAQPQAKNARSTQLFINTGDNARLDRLGFTPIGEVVSGMDIVDKIFAQYGEEPDQNKIRSQGNGYLEGKYPRLDYIKKATIVPPAPPQ